MKAPHRRGICPGLSAPMPTGDGLLVRLRPTDPIPLNAFAGFCEAARQHGNGIIEISARGSLQVRGLTPRSAPLFASAVAELGIAAHDGVSVIAGFDLMGQVSTTDVAAGLRRAVTDARLALSPKISIVVDGGGRLHLDALSADIRLRAVASPQGPRFHLGIGDDGASATWLGMVAPKDAVGAVLHILTIIAAYGPTTRAADVLRTEGIEGFRSISAAIAEPLSAPPLRMPAEMIGVHPAYGGTVAIGVGFAFGHAHADALAEVVRLAAIHGAHAAWPAPDRALLLIGVSARDALNLAVVAEQLGFVVHPTDPRRRIAACPGAPACASGLVAARSLASALAPILGPVLKAERNGVFVHISGCSKGCAHPNPAALTVVGTPRGCGIVHHGSARMTPGHHVDPANLGDEILRFAAQRKEAAHG